MLKVKSKTLNIRGFTLVELVVAMSVFIIAITIAVGAFVQALKTQRAVNHLLSVNSNASLVVEQIAREIRTGYGFDLDRFAPPLCTGGDYDRLIFTNSRTNQVTYELREGTILREECVGADCSVAEFEPLTASNIRVRRLCFTNTGSLENNRDPWRITFSLAVGSSDLQFSGDVLNLQTTVAARILPEELP